jgi:hypothetical protein
MCVIRMLIAALTIALLFPLGACSGSGSGEPGTVFKREADLAAIKPARPVKIKLKRSPKGDYSWDLSGSDVEEVLKVDMRLKEFLRTTR